jgi:filamentous hemagglutinin family protein
MRLIQGGIVGITIGVWAMGSSAIAQIVPDATLGIERSQVSKLDVDTDLIKGGALRGANLFHSFQDFNIEVGRSAYFVAPSTIVQNILARVTGKSYSEISGFLGVARQQANGRLSGAPNVNLFLINPNGILFTEGARLDIGGSFLATTANSVSFGNFGEFSATNPQSPSALLTINPTAFFINQVNPENIIVDQARLKLTYGKNLSLLAGNILINGSDGQLATYGGRIELAAIVSPTIVGVNPNASLAVSEQAERGTIKLRDAASIDVIDEAVSGGSIRLTAKDILILDKSRVVAGVYRQFDNLQSQAGDIVLDATNFVGINGGFVRNRIQSNAIGNSGGIFVKTGDLIIFNGGSISNNVAGTGTGGNINIIADRSVTIYAASSLASDTGDFTGIQTVVEGGAIGNVGDISIKTDFLDLTNGARVSSQTYGTGNSGNISVASDSIRLSGTTLNPDLTRTIPSGIATESRSDTTGKSGNIVIASKLIGLSDGASISASTFGQGSAGNIDVVTDVIVLSGQTLGGGTPSGIFSSIVTEDAVGAAGNLNISARDIVLKDGGAISTNTYGKGNSGDVQLTATRSISLTGTTSNGTASRVETQTGSTAIGNSGNIFINAGRVLGTDGASISASTAGKGNAGNINVEAKSISLKGRSPLGPASRILSAVFSGAKGFGGNVNIKTDSLTLFSRGLVSTSTLGDGPAGNVEIQAKTIRLYYGSILSTAFSFGNGGNVKITSDLLLTRLKSRIATEGGPDALGGDGGNIDISSKFILAIPKEDSDISASTFQGKGGQVRINTQGLFGITPLSRPNNKLSDITASSDLGVQGTVAINQPNIRPEQGLNELPTGLIDPASRISKECPRGYTDRPMGRFIITGKGGLPTSLIDPSSTSLPLPPLISSPENTAIGRVDRPQLKPAEPIVEAQGFARDRDGQVQLVAQSTGGNTPIAAIHCYANK